MEFTVAVNASQMFQKLNEVKLIDCLVKDQDRFDSSVCSNCRNDGDILRVEILFINGLVGVFECIVMSWNSSLSKDNFIYIYNFFLRIESIF
jgi:hypothetical protein